MQVKIWIMLPARLSLSEVERDPPAAGAGGKHPAPGDAACRAWGDPRQAAKDLLQFLHAAVAGRPRRPKQLARKRLRRVGCSRGRRRPQARCLDIRLLRRPTSVGPQLSSLPGPCPARRALRHRLRQFDLRAWDPRLSALGDRSGQVATAAEGRHLGRLRRQRREHTRPPRRMATSLLAQVRC